MSNDLDPLSASADADPLASPEPTTAALRLLAADDALLCVDDACLPPDLPAISAPTDGPDDR